MLFKYDKPNSTYAYYKYNHRSIEYCNTLQILNTIPNMNNTISITLCLFLMVLHTESLFGRDIAMQYLELDHNHDYLLSNQQLTQQYRHHNSQSDRQFYNLKQFKQLKYSNSLFKQYDTDGDQWVSRAQFQRMARQKWMKYADLYGTGNILKYINEETYMESCDTDKNGKLDRQEVKMCVKVVTAFEEENYPHRVQSLLYANKNVGYDREEFLKLMKNFKNVQGATLQQYVNRLFELFEWSQTKIEEDHDELIGPEEGKIMQPIFIMMMLDKNADGSLDKKQMVFFTSKAGGPQIFQAIDVNSDGKVDQNQFVAYHYFASCVDCGNNSNSNQNKKDGQKQKQKGKQKQKKKQGQQL